MENHIIIMAGGIGSRFWPMSTPDYPKQFIDVLGIGKSLLQLTIDRFLPICSIQNCWVVTSKKYVNIVKEQLPELPESHILAEPVSRNTAPCIAYACWKIKKECPKANIVVSPSDALVINTTEFERCIKIALDRTSFTSSIITLGMQPTRPETGYGYIAATKQTVGNEIYKVKAFKEKPDLKTAQFYLQEGSYFWNAGIFIWNVDTIIEAIQRYCPQIADIMNKLYPSLFTSEEPKELEHLFPLCEKKSIDYAVMEKAENLFVLPAEFGWSDLGSWGSLKNLLQQDSHGNAVIGPKVSLYDCKDCITHISNEKEFIIQGLNNYIIAERNNKVLICSLSEEQRIKDFTAK